MSDTDIDAGNLNVSPQSKYDDTKDTTVFLGNTYERTFELRFHHLADVRSFLGLVPTGKNVRIETGAFAYSKEAEAKKALLLQAIADAKDSAEMLAKGVGKRLSSLHNVSDRPQGGSYSYSGATRSFNAPPAPAGLSHSSEVVLKEGVVTLEEDAYVIYLIGD
jgi:uncharacterized protein YggE